MIQSQVIKKLALEMASQTGHVEDMKIYKQYIRMALVVGMEHFDPRMEEIIAIDKNGTEISFKSEADAAEKLGLNVGNINKVLQGRKKTIGGYSFVKATEKPKPIETPSEKPFLSPYRHVPAKEGTYMGYKAIR